MTETPTTTADTTPAAVVRDFVEVVRSGWQPDRAFEFLAPTVLAHQVRGDAPETIERSPQDYAEHVREMRRMFGDFQLTVDELLADGDRVYVRWTQRGTHAGVIGPFEPTGREITTIDSAVYRVEGGLIREYWIQADSAGLAAQLEAGDDTATD